MDIAKEGILAASNHHAQKALWIVADLAQLPFRDESCGALINMLTPSNYKEFNRVLASGGKLIKIIPGSHYLIELRQQLYKSNEEKQHYSNEDIVERFKTRISIYEDEGSFLSSDTYKRNVWTPITNDTFILGS